MKTGVWLGAFIIVLGLCLQASSGELSMLQGRVVDDRGNPAAKYPVYLETSKGPIVAFTDSQGIFQFFDLQPGLQYTISVTGGTQITVQIERSVQKLPRDLVVGAQGGTVTFRSVASGSTICAGKSISYEVVGKTSAATSSSSSVDKCTIEMTVDGKHEVRVTEVGVEYQDTKVTLKDFTRVEVRIEGEELKVLVDGRQVVPKLKK